MTYESMIINVNRFHEGGFWTIKTRAYARNDSLDDPEIWGDDDTANSETDAIRDAETLADYILATGETDSVTILLDGNEHACKRRPVPIVLRETKSFRLVKLGESYNVAAVPTDVEPQVRLITRDNAEELLRYSDETFDMSCVWDLGVGVFDKDDIDRTS
jgi:hypothetical protein